MKILIGISGAIGVLEIHRYLQRLQAEAKVDEIRVVMTPTAARFVNPKVLEAHLHQTVRVDPWTDEGRMVSPPEIVTGVDVYLVAPASATTLARCATGSGETLVANCYLCHDGPVAFAPTMNPEMWNHPAVQRNVDQLQEDGATILPPGVGVSAATGELRSGAICPYDEMWRRLQALVPPLATTGLAHGPSDSS